MDWDSDAGDPLSIFLWTKYKPARLSVPKLSKNLAQSIPSSIVHFDTETLYINVASGKYLKLEGKNKWLVSVRDLTVVEQRSGKKFPF